MGILRLFLAWVVIYLLVVGLSVYAVQKKSPAVIALVFSVGVLTTLLIGWLLQPVLVGGWSHQEEMWSRFREVGHFFTRMWSNRS